MTDLDDAIRDLALAESELNDADAAVYEAERARMEAQDKVKDAHKALQVVLHERKQHLVTVPT